MTYPVHWAYNGMGQAVDNLGLECNLTPAIDNGNATSWYQISGNNNSGSIEDYFYSGDELYVLSENGSVLNHVWVNQIENNKITLINRDGSIYNECGENTDIIKIKIVRSHERNLQTASMASVTSMTNPVSVNNGSVFNSFTSASKIVNASAVEYEDFWRPQKENNFAPYPWNVDIEGIVNAPLFGTNPFITNIKGDWRAVKSYAYLTGRTNNASPRNDGFFTSFNPFYEVVSNTWVKNTNNWTYASEVTKYSPFGAELENKDALQRYSSAQYGYGYTLPTAVASNSQYREIGFDGFEDYNLTSNSINNIDSNSLYPQLDQNSHFNPHFSFLTKIDEVSSFRTDITSHTGKYSLKLNPNSSIGLVKEYEGKGKCEPTFNISDCIDENNQQICFYEMYVGAINMGYPQTHQRIEDTNIPYSGTNIIVNNNCSIMPNVDEINFIENSLGNIRIIYTHNNSQPYPSNGQQCIIGVTFEDNNGVVLCTAEIKLYEVMAGDYYSRYTESSSNQERECSSFYPIPNKDYIISGWLKQDKPNSISYSNDTGILLTLYDDIGQSSGQMISSELFYCSGKIIDGWQRVIGKFKAPNNDTLTHIRIELFNNSSVDSFFDDIRVFPVNGTMKSFVYDEDTQRLVAELDENNYATFYEYDNEGGLVRVKKETEEGVYTIQETRSNTVKEQTEN